MQELAEAGREGPERAGGGVRQGARHRHLRPRDARAAARRDGRPQAFRPAPPGAWSGVASETGLDAARGRTRQRATRWPMLLDAARRARHAAASSCCFHGRRRPPGLARRCRSRTSTTSRRCARELAALGARLPLPRGHRRRLRHRRRHQRHASATCAGRSARCSPSRAWPSSACRPRASGSACSSRSARWTPRCDACTSASSRRRPLEPTPGAQWPRPVSLMT